MIRDEKAKSFGQWVMIGTVAAACVILWFVAEWVGPYLGYELTTGLGLFIGLFVVVGAMRLGDRAEWWMAARRRRAAR